MRSAAPIGTLIEMLAAVPSVVIGLWGIFVLAPFIAQHVEPFLSRYFGWIPIFSGTAQQVESTASAAIIVLTIMIIPITSSICRELFVSVPARRQGGSHRSRRDALGDGARRRRPVRAGGVVAAITLGLGRALGEAIAVTQVIGNFIPLQLSLFEPGNTLASQLANQYQSATTNIEISVADLPRADPARDHVRDELRRAADRAPLRRVKRAGWT